MKEKRVSNYELFYDLVFVLATSVLTGFLHSSEGVSWYELMQFIIANLSVWCLWFTENVYLNKYSERGPHDVYTIIASMLVIGNMVMGLTLHWRETTTSLFGIEVPVFIPFNLLLLIAYGIIIMQYYLHCRNYRISMTKDMKAQIQWILWTMALIALATVTSYMQIIDGVYVYFVAYIIALFVPRKFTKNFDNTLVNFPHMVERTQLITILTFGEVVIATIKTFPLMNNIITGSLSFVAMAFMFVAYISQTALSMDHHSQKPSTLLVYLHLVIVMAINLFTAGLEMIGDQHHATTTGLQLVILGMVLFYGCLAALTVYNKHGAILTKQYALQYVLATILLMGALWIGSSSLEWIFASLCVYTYMMEDIGYRFRKKYIYKEN